MVRSMFGPCGVIATRPGIDIPCTSLTYFRNRFFPTSEMSDTVAGGPMPPLTVEATFPPSTLTDTAKVIGPICDVIGAVQSPMNGAACAGETVDPAVCNASSTGALSKGQSWPPTMVNDSRKVSGSRRCVMGLLGTDCSAIAEYKASAASACPVDAAGDHDGSLERCSWCSSNHCVHREPWLSARSAATRC